MPNVLGDIRFTVTVANETIDFVSLRELLLTQEQRPETAVVSYTPTAEEATEQGPTVRTRKASRRAARSRTAPQNFTSPNSQAQTRSIFQAAVDRVQALNAQVLNTSDINFGVALQSSQNSNVPIEPPPPDFPRAGEGVIIPSIIALADYTPIVDGAGQLNSVAKSLEFKRSARRLSVDMQVVTNPFSLRAQGEMQRLKIADSLKDYINKRDNFIRSLGARLRSAEEKMNLVFSTNHPPSNTEYLATIIRDYANSAFYASGDFVGSPDRNASANDNGVAFQLAETVEAVDPAYKDLHDTFQANYLGTAGGTTATESNFLYMHRVSSALPAEKRMRFVAGVVGKETVASFNISKHPKYFHNAGGQPATPAPPESPSTITTSALSALGAATPNLLAASNASLLTSVNPIGISNRSILNPITPNRNLFIPNVIFNADPNTRSIKIPVSGDPASFFVSAVFRRQEPGRDEGSMTVSYPFEATKSRGRSQKTSFEFVKELINPYFKDDRQITIAYGDSSGNIFESPYRAFANSANKACDVIEQVFQRDPAEATYMQNTFIAAATLVARQFKEEIEGLNEPVLELAMLDMAATDTSFARRLLVYLAFRQEAELKYDGVGFAPRGPSHLLRNDAYLQNDPILNQGESVVSKTSTIFPSNVKVDPALQGGGSSVSEVTAPPETTTLTVEQNATAGNAGTLESVFGISLTSVIRELSLMFSEKARNEYQLEITTPGIRITFSHPVIVHTLLRTRGGTLFSQLSDFPSYYLPGLENTNQSYSIIGQSHYTGMKEHMIFAGFFDMVCTLTQYTFNRMFVKRRTDASYGGILINKSVPKFGRKHGYANRARMLRQFSRNNAGVITEPNISEEFSRNFDLISKTITALRDEHDFMLDFPTAFKSRNEKIATDFRIVKESLDVQVPGIEGNLPLGRYIANGLVPSLDTARYLAQYSAKMNAASMFYNGVKTNDPVLSDESYNMMRSILGASSASSNRGWQNNSNTKVIVVGIPCGLLEDLDQSTPITNALDGQKNSVKPMFDVVITKFDETNPFVEYDPLRVTFSRQLFFKEFNANGNPTFTAVDRDLQVFDLGEDQVQALQRGFSQPEQRSLAAGVLANHYDDWVLKTYFDLQYDLDFQESAFPNNTDRLKNIYSTKIDIPSLEYVDVSQAEFLSASNAQFSPTPISLQTSNFYDPNKNCIDLQNKSSTNPYEYSLFDYVNTYGTLFEKNTEGNKVSSGMIFERVLCIAFTDEDFNTRMDTRMLEMANQPSAPASPDSYAAPSMFTYSVTISLQGDQLNLIDREVAT